VAVASAGLYASLHLIPDNHANISPLKFFTGRTPFLPPNQQRPSTEGKSKHWYTYIQSIWQSKDNNIKAISQYIWPGMYWQQAHQLSYHLRLEIIHRGFANGGHRLWYREVLIHNGAVQSAVNRHIDGSFQDYANCHIIKLENRYLFWTHERQKVAYWEDLPMDTYLSWNIMGWVSGWQYSSWSCIIMHNRSGSILLAPGQRHGSPSEYYRSIGLLHKQDEQTRLVCSCSQFSLFPQTKLAHQHSVRDVCPKTTWQKIPVYLSY